MKKLMIAAVMAGVVGAAFADCEIGTECAWAYRIKLAGKTVKALSKTTGSTATCDLDSNCWAKAASYRVAGYLYNPGVAPLDDCDECGCDTTLLGGGDLSSHFWNEKKEEVVFGDVAIESEILRNSGAKNKAQILITLDGLNLAGFGVYNPNTLKLKRASGFFAGKLAAAECAGAYDAATCELGNATPAMVFKPCDLAEAVESEFAIAFGRWNLAYKADKVAAIQNPNIGISALYPAAFKAAEEP